MSIRVSHIVEQVIVGVVLAIISAFANYIFADKVNLLFVLATFVSGVLVAAVITRFSGGLPFLDLSGLVGESDESEGHGGTVTGAQLAQMVNGMYSGDMVETVQSLAPNITGRLTADQVCRIMSGAYSGDQVTILDSLEPKIQRPLSDDDIEEILAGLYSGDRKLASAILARHK